MILNSFNKKHSQALIELIISIALTIFFLSAFIVNLSYITNSFTDYKQKYFAYQVIKEQKKINDRNVAYLLANYKITKDYATNNYFPNQGNHLNYTYLNYTSVDENTFFKNQEKTLFLNDDYIYHWSFDAVPSTSTYIVDDKGDNDRKGTLSCSGAACSNPVIMSKSKGKCVSNNCLLFEEPLNAAGTITFPLMSTLNSSSRNKTTWEAWVYNINPAQDSIFMSKGDYNYFGIINDFATVQFKIGNEIVPLIATTPILPEAWYHLAVSYDGTNIRIYVNGVLTATSDNISGTIDYNNILKFGYFTESDPKGFNGYLDEIKIYGRALTDNEILSHYNGYRKQMGLLAHWHFDDALNTATYSGASETGLNPRYTSFSSPDDIPILMEKTTAIDNPTLCKSGSCSLFNRDYSSKGILDDSTHNYVQLHNFYRATLSANIKLTEINTGYQGIVGKINNTNGTYSLSLFDDDIFIAFKIEDIWVSELYPANLTTNKWYQIDVTFDGLDMKLYIDGVLKFTWNHPGGITGDSNYGNIYIGYTGIGNEYFDGYIDEVKIYNRALSSEEINNLYDNSFTYYQYFKPVCKVSANGTISSECLNCNPTSSTECERSISGNNFEPLLIKSIHIVKYGKGLNYKQIKNEQIIPVVNSFYNQDAGTNVWGGGYTPYIGISCGLFVFGTEGDSAGVNIKYNSACGSSSCGRQIMNAEVCDAENISFYYDNGCTTCSGSPGDPDWSCDACEAAGYFEKTNNEQEGYFISSTFNFPKKMALTSFGWTGTGGPINFQFACLDDIVVGGTEVPEENWIYLGQDVLNSKRCSASSYYSAVSGTSYPVSSCWETDNQSLHNCQFFRFKVKIDAGVSAVVNNIKLNFGQYPYTIIK